MIFGHHKDASPEQRTKLRSTIATSLGVPRSCSAELARHSRWDSDLIDKPFALPTCLGTSPQLIEALRHKGSPKRKRRNSA